MFGHEIHLNFNKDGKQHKTVVGGACSVTIKLIMLIYVALNVKRLLLHEDNQEAFSTELVDFAKEEDVFYTNSTDLTQFYVVYKQHGGMRPLELTNVTERYLKFEFVQVYLNHPENIVQVDYIPVKSCTLEEFSQSEDMKSKFQLWQEGSYSLLCPDVKDDSELVMSGDSSSAIQRSFEFQAFKCYNSTDEDGVEQDDCESPEAIDAFVKDIEIQQWIIEEQIDFTIYGRKPTYTRMKWQNSQLLDPNFSFLYHNYLRKNRIHTEDDWIDLGQERTWAYYDLSRQLFQKQHIDSDYSDILFASINYLDQQNAIHIRKIFNFIDLLGVMGGVMELIIFMFGVLLFPISKHSFFLVMIRKLFLARTSHKEFFKKSNDNLNENEKRKLTRRESRTKVLGSQIMHELSNYRVINLNFRSSLKLFFMN